MSGFSPLPESRQRDSPEMLVKSILCNGTAIAILPRMIEIKGVARLKIHPGKQQEFKDLQAQFFAVVRAKDTGTLQYETFFNADFSECIVYERYRDSAALLEHAANLGALTAALSQVSSGSGELLGMPSPQLRTVLAGSPVRIYEPYESL